MVWEEVGEIGRLPAAHEEFTWGVATSDGHNSESQEETL